MGNDIRICFTIGEPGRFISHLDVLRTIERGIRRSKLPIAYSKGFHPLPKFNFASPLPVGVTSEVEYADLQMDTHISALAVKERLNKVLPIGFNVTDAMELPNQYQALMGIVASARYELTVINKSILLAELNEKVTSLLNESELLVTVRRKKGDQIRNIRPLIHQICFDVQQNKILLECASGSQGNVRPMDVLQFLSLNLGDVIIHRTALFVRNKNEELVTPFEVIKE